MTTQQPANNTERKLPQMTWHTRAYLLWTMVGTGFGVLAGFLYTRAAKEHAARNGGKPPEPGTIELMGLIVAAIALVRQITELGKPNEPKK